MEHQPDWRPVIAALANPHARELFAQVVLGHSGAGEGLGAARRRNVVDALVKAGLVRAVGDQLEPRPEAFTALLATQVRPERSTGPERFLDAHGMIDRFPSNAAELRGLLALVAARVLAPGEVISEAELNGRLRVFTPDVALLRRHLVDHELLERTASGSEYALSDAG
ncbi:MAG: DUF2087 domain-containing protein [Actinomycetales bacterium]|nr:DUF2087 domain-containing protein [Actinomycetales bacterium]